MNNANKKNKSIKIWHIILVFFLIISALTLGFTVSYLIINQRNVQSSFEDAGKIGQKQPYLDENYKGVKASNKEDKTIEELAKLKNAIVKIETDTSQGSGVLIDQSGYLLTNWHVVDGNTGRINIKLHSNSDKMYLEPLNAKLVAYDPFIDIALLKVEDIEKYSEATFLELGNMDEVKDGQSIVVIGSPKGLTNTISEGIISAIRTDEKRTDIQITAPLSEGSSGGALLNGKGELIGITTYKIKDGESLNFAISLKDVIEFLDREYIKDFTKYKQKKQILGEGEIEDFVNGIVYDYIIYSDNLKDGGKPYISPDYLSEYESEKLREGNGRIAYSNDEATFQVAEINVYNPHFDDSLSIREDPLLNREPDAIPMTLVFMGDKKQIYLLNGKDDNYPDILLISSYYQDSLWILVFMSLEDGNFIEWDVDEYDESDYRNIGWTGVFGTGTYIRRQFPNFIEIIQEHPESLWYTKYRVDYFDNAIRAIDYNQEIYDIAPYLKEEGWIKIGK